MKLFVTAYALRYKALLNIAASYDVFTDNPVVLSCNEPLVQSLHVYVNPQFGDNCPAGLKTTYQAS